MKFSEQDTELLKQWVIKRLSDISDADADILADYCLALLTTDEPDDVVKSNSTANLQDFLQDQTESFVNEVFNIIVTRGYDPNAPKIVPAHVPHHQPFQSRKRGFEDDDAPNGRIHSLDISDRPVKQMRRGGRGGFDTGRARHFAQTPAEQQWQPSQPMQIPQMPQLPGMAPFDPSDPMALMAAMQQAMGMPNMMQKPPVQKKTGKRCRDYDNKGFCARGASCIYEHGDDAYVMPGNEPYDPSNAVLPGLSGVGNANTFAFDSSRGGTRGRGRGRGIGAYRGGNRRADISALGPNHDHSNTTIVVEQIPEDKFDEQSVRAFFGEFGNIEEVDMQAYKRLATVKYSEFWSAKAAYESPKVVFENRFVKVYWYKGDTLQIQQVGEEEMRVKEEKPQIDLAKIAKRQEEAQRRHEEQKKQREEQEKQRSEMDAKLKALEAEKKKMADMMAKKTGKSSAAQSPTASNGTPADDKNKGLREQLAKLEAEAKSLGIDPNSAIDSGWTSSYTPQGRGGWRGRGGFAPRGRGWNPGFRGGRGGGAVKRLDNRPKTVSIAFASGTYDEHDEALRQYLVLSGNLDHAELLKHPARSDAALLAFQERYRAENFMAAATSGIPHVGQVDLSWQANAPIAMPSNSANGDDDGNEAMADAELEASEPEVAAMPDAAQAFDVADDDDDRW